MRVGLVVRLMIVSFSCETCLDAAICVHHDRGRRPGSVCLAQLGAVSGTGSEKEIDPTDSYQIGLLLGMTGGTITEAAVARFALEHLSKPPGERRPQKRWELWSAT